MRIGWMPFLIIAVVAGSTTLSASESPDGSGSARPSPGKTSDSMLQTGTFTSAEICSGCHKDIHAGWSASVHAGSYVDPAFQEALSKVASEGSPADPRKDPRNKCLSCHAPATLGPKSASADPELVREGITCSFCHSIVGAKTSWAWDAFTLDPGQTMRGPFQYASSPGHKTQYSALHRTALMCAPCHQFSTPSGVAVLNTFEEWRTGPWPSQGVQCQDCHMALVRGAVAEHIPLPAQISAQDRRLINLHKLVGGSSLGQVRRALTAKVRSTRRTSGTITIAVEVTNDAAGHRAPTGLPSRSIELTIEASNASKIFHTDKKVYRRDLLDASGARIVSDGDAFLRTARVGHDTRLAPGETRVETFSFAAPPGAASVAVGLEYVVAGGIANPARRRERFQELAVEVP